MEKGGWGSCVLAEKTYRVEKSRREENRGKEEGGEGVLGPLGKNESAKMGCGRG